MTDFPTSLPDDATALEEIISIHENAAEPLKGDARARIIWQDEQKKEKTAYSIVYLHGFKGSQAEGYPTHQTIANMLGCNLYLARLSRHGLKRKENFSNLSSKKLLQSAVDACRVGEKIGEKVIVMGTSTGASLALYTAAVESTLPISTLVLYSPLVHLYGINSLLFENPIGRSFLRLIPGKDYTLGSDPFSPKEEAIWYSSYCLNGALALGETIQKIMRPSVFSKVQCPVFAGYYYKNAAHHDRVVSTPAIKRMMKRLGTPPSKQMLTNFSGAESHVIANSLLSHAVNEVIEQTAVFLTRHTSQISTR